MANNSNIKLKTGDLKQLAKSALEYCIADIIRDIRQYETRFNIKTNSITLGADGVTGDWVKPQAAYARRSKCKPNIGSSLKHGGKYNRKYWQAMDSKAFYDTVKRMREAQKQYFKTRRPCDLQRSKEIEKIIDNEIARVERILWQQKNPPLL